MKRRWIVILGFVLLALGGLYFFMISGVEAPGSSNAKSSSQSPSNTPVQFARNAPAGAKEYRNAHYHFSLLYPDSLSVKEYDEGGGAMTISFQNPQTAQGFSNFYRALLRSTDFRRAF
jgi:hypothetical protein